MGIKQTIIVAAEDVLQNGGQKEDQIAEKEIQGDTREEDREGGKEADEVYSLTPKTMIPPPKVALETAQTSSVAHASSFSDHTLNSKRQLNLSSGL